MLADRYAKSAATGKASMEEIPERYGEKTSLSHMTRVATEARSRETAEWIWRHTSLRPTETAGDGESNKLALS